MLDSTSTMQEVFRYCRTQLPLNESGFGAAAHKIRSKETERMFGIRVETSLRIEVNQGRGREARWHLESDRECNDLR